MPGFCQQHPRSAPGYQDTAPAPSPTGSSSSHPSFPAPGKPRQIFGWGREGASSRAPRVQRAWQGLFGTQGELQDKPRREFCAAEGGKTHTMGKGFVIQAFRISNPSMTNCFQTPASILSAPFIRFPRCVRTAGSLFRFYFIIPFLFHYSTFISCWETFPVGKGNFWISLSPSQTPNLRPETQTLDSLHFK